MLARRSVVLDLSAIALVIAASMAACSGGVEVPSGPTSSGSGGSASGSSSSSGAGGCSSDSDCNDFQECTVDTCKSGECFFTVASENEPCTWGDNQIGFCQSGKCVASDCPFACPDPGPCNTLSCENPALCTFVPLPDGTVIMFQTAGDCATLQCLDGEPTPFPDDTDVADDGNDCTADTCAQGMAISTPLPAGAACAFMGNQPGLCDGAGFCVACLADADCLGFAQNNECQTTSCQMGSCATAFAPAGTQISAMYQFAGDCHVLVCDGQGGIGNSIDDTDVPNDNKICTQDLCQNGVPTNPLQPPGFLCPNGAPCALFPDCGCLSNADCSPPDTCGGGGTPYACGCTAGSCASLGKTCGFTALGCLMSANCDTGTKNGSETDVDCGGPVAACPTRCGIGKKCSAGSDCASGFCADGVCCDAACNGPCSACTAAKKGGGQDGACGFVAAGTDPDNECATSPVATCGTNGVCDGAGACQLYPAGTVCTAPSCSGGWIASKADTCNGTGTCIDQGTLSCYPFACSNGACFTSCMTNAQCAGALSCVGGMCVILDGACGSGAECASGFCVDGVCCATSCTGTCQACSFIKKGSGPNGTCGNIGAGLDPDDECAGAMTCNGIGACM